MLNHLYKYCPPLGLIPLKTNWIESKRILRADRQRGFADARARAGMVWWFGWALMGTEIA